MASLMVRLGFEVDGMAQGKASSHCLGCVLITGVGLLINSAFERYSSPRCLRLHSGSALYTYWIGCTVQLALLPALLTLIVRDTAPRFATWSLWLNAEWSQLTSPWHALFHYVFFGYLMKDMFTPMSTVFYVHHAVCMALTVLSLAEWPVPCSAVFVLMVMVLEFGSCALSLSRQYPTSQLLNHLSLVVMGVSNTSAALLAIWFGLYFGRGDTLASRWALPMIGYGMMFGRQDLEWKRWKDHGKAHAA
jgi:hypothetical protein